MKEMMNEKNSFILYASYEEQLNMLTDAQAGQLLRSVYVYARTGEQHSDDPMVALLLSVICHQMDLDIRKYEETKERRKEAGRKGGLQTAKNKTKTKKASKNSNAKNAAEPVEIDGLQASSEADEIDIAKQSAANTAVYVDEDVNVNENVNENNYSGDGDDVGGEEEDHGRELIYYTDNGYPTTQTELDKVNVFAENLFRRYWNRKVSSYDQALVYDWNLDHGSGVLV